MLDNIHIVLSHTSHPGNIGATARALKTMGLSKLTLVNPKSFPHIDATAMAAGSDDILNQSVTTNSLDKALENCHLIIGTSARDRSLEWPMLTPRTAAEKIVSAARVGPVALLFGRESNGLTNEELQLCHYHVQIPANDNYSSLNIAAAVQILAYEIRMASLTVTPTLPPEREQSEITAEQMASFYQQLETVLTQINFLKANQPNRIMQRLRRLFQRAQLEEAELNILRGILTEVSRKCGKVS